MDLKDLMAGIAVVIDDALDQEAPTSDNGDRTKDRISDIVRLFQQKWSIPFYKASKMPPDHIWSSLLESASFVLLDWKLWPDGASELEKYMIEKHRRFLQKAKEFSVPVFIFTNENTDDIEDELRTIYQGQTLKKSFVFVQRKDDLFSNDSLNLDPVHKWIKENASVYTLKKWDQLFRVARKSLFRSMYAISPDWPRIFWHAYQRDGVDPSFGLTQLISDGLWGRMQTNAFTPEVLGSSNNDDLQVQRDDLRALIEATTFRATAAEDDIRCGDLFKLHRRKFLLNIRPDCDCIPRDGLGRNNVDLYCIEGKKIRESKLTDAYRRGHFRERSDQSIVFAATEGKSIRFRFKNLRVKTFGELQDQRIGRLLHPYLTRIQQRYALYLQRQGLPSVPAGAVSTDLVDSAK